MNKTDRTVEITTEYFDTLPPRQQRQLALKSLAWFCVIESLNPYFTSAQAEINTIKIILNKFCENDETV